ncbi:acyl-CoA-like ligand-binding transcription factor [Rathayibacter sp. Leaf248]|uniref:acyl-CoA-like ligand-binding transcription factor n=1 Tax=Rathayibacter sp. Leaf248 TaxID=2876555 RepID=UPI001E36EC69|nr:hypothetical protein [Rathayibacter sp. Leaf248]
MTGVFENTVNDVNDDLFHTSRENQPLLLAVHGGFVQTIASSGAGEDDRRKILKLVLATPALRAAWLTAGRVAQDDLSEIIRGRRPDLSPIACEALAAATAATLTVALETWVTTPGIDLDDAAGEALSVLRAALDRD